MGFKGHLLWNDAIYGNSSNWIDSNYNFSSNCFMVTICSIWTVEIISLIYLL
jgi:hypothetical protein